MPIYSVARIIQAEAPTSSPAGQFAVASVIYNRMQAGGFGGTDALSVANADGQFAGHLTGAGGPGNVPLTPSPYAAQLGAALEAGNAPPGGSTGNALYFQSNQGQPSSVVGGSSANIGGNYFSDRFGQPSNDFQAPSYTGAGIVAANGPPDASSGLPAGPGAGTMPGINPNTGEPDIPGVTTNYPTAAPSANPSDTPGAPGTTPGLTQPGQVQKAVQSGGEGVANVVLGVSNTFFGDLNTWITDTLGRFGQAFQTALTASEKSIADFFGGIANWFVRGFLIILGAILIILALAAITGKSAIQYMQPKGTPA